MPSSSTPEFSGAFAPAALAVAGREAAVPGPVMAFVVRDSAIHGRGAFASRSILAGTRVGEYAGERISKEEADRRHEQRQHDGYPAGDYTFALDSDTEIDGLAGGNGTAFINHGCEPNCAFARDDGRVFIDAIRDIPEGAELLLDYRLRTAVPLADDALDIFACYCGAFGCRGTMLSASNVTLSGG